jgi:ubiquinone/menaquinone biosynthesis C-methylase UbiE
MEDRSSDIYNEDKIKALIDDYYTKTIDGVYFAHQPIYGYRSKYADTSQISRYMITRSVLDVLARYEFTELMDISGGEGYTAHLIRTMFGAKVRITDWSESVCEMARKIYGLQAEVVDIKKMPYADNQFEVVLCSETLEHIVDWEIGFEELLRISDKLLVITVPSDSIEYVEYNRKHVLSGHINHFVDTTFDFLKSRNIQFSVEKNNCPKLLKARVLAEGYKKKGGGLGYKVYNAFTPFLKMMFGKKTAQWLIDNDVKFINSSKEYGGLCIVIEKNAIAKKTNYQPIKAKDFMDIVVPEYKVERK